MLKIYILTIAFGIRCADVENYLTEQKQFPTMCAYCPDWAHAGSQVPANAKLALT